MEVKLRLFGLTLTAAATVAAIGAAPQPASALISPNGSFGFVSTGAGAITVNTGDITLATATKTLPTPLVINQIAPTFMGNPNNLGLTNLSTVTFTPMPVPVPAGTGVTVPVAETVTVPTTAGAGGTLTFTFTSGRTVTRAATIGGTPPSAGGFNEQFLGTLSGDTSGTFTLGVAADFSESCTQTAPSAVINCSDTISIPTAVTFTPEPASLALLGVGLAGLGLFRARRRKTA